MIRRPARFVLALTASVAALSILSLTPVAHADPVTELTGDGPKVIPLKNMAMVTKTKWGLRYTAGQQDGHLTVTYSYADGTIRFADTGTEKWRTLSKLCTKERVDVGVAASCRLPSSYRDGRTMFVEIWPRLGDDYVDASSMPAEFRMWVLADQGDDTVYTGAGDDFVNGASGDDTVFGGDGDDWLRTGKDDDVIYGQGGNDRLVGVSGADKVHGGDGNDSVEGGTGNDQLWADLGSDKVLCGSGSDDAWMKADDRASGCESVNRE